MGINMDTVGIPEKAPRPVKVLIVTSCPDPVAQWYGAFNPEEKKSPYIKAIERAWEEMGDAQPYSLSEVGLTSGLGCRHINFAARDNLLAPTKTSVNICSSRLKTEVMLFDPLMILCAGHSPFIAMSGETKISKYTERYEEAFTWEFLGPKSNVLQYPVYVMPSPMKAIEDGRKDQWAESFKFEKPGFPEHEPVQYFYWTLLRGLNLCHALESARAGRPPNESWLDVIEIVDTFHNQRISSAAAEKSVLEIANPILEQENQLSARDAFLFDLLSTDSSDDGEADEEDEEDEGAGLFEDEDEDDE